MNKDESTKEFTMLVMEFKRQNPFYNRLEILNILAEKTLNALPQYKPCRGFIEDIARRMDFLQAALFVEMERGNFTIVNGFAVCFIRVWEEALIKTFDNFSTCIGNKDVSYVKEDIREFELVFPEIVEDSVADFITHRKIVTNQIRRDDWLDMVDKAYERSMTFG